MMKLRLYLHDELALAIDPGAGRYGPPDSVEWFAAATRLSCGWKPPCDLFELYAWLSHLVPENGMRLAFAEAATKLFESLRVRRDPSTVCDWIWGNPGVEYAGAVSFKSILADGREMAEEHAASIPLNDDRIGQMLRYVSFQTSGSSVERAAPVGEGRVSNTGTRAKTAIHLDATTRRWRTTSPDHLSTHIVKHEDRSDLPGEAVAEAVCQRALRLLGVPASEASARVFGGIQAVVSARSDRRTDARGSVIPVHQGVHQEEWAQAACLEMNEKFEYRRETPTWADFHEMLTSCSSNPERDSFAFIQALAACVLLGHTDLHRQNIGILHDGSHADGPTCRLAPMYDVSSMDGRGDHYTKRLALSIAGARTPDEVHVSAWRRLARACGLDGDGVVDTVLDVAQRLPGTFEQAKRDSRCADEARSLVEASRRLEAMSTKIESRCRRLAIG